MARSLVVIIPFADHGVGDTITGDAADVVLAGPHAGHVVRGVDADDVAPAADTAPETPAPAAATAG